MRKRINTQARNIWQINLKTVIFLPLIIISTFVNSQEPGTLDPGFGLDGLVTFDLNSHSQQAYTCGMQSDGKILIAGNTETNSFEDDDFTVMKFLPDGTPDNTFGTNGVAVFDYGSGKINSLVLQPDGYILIGGKCDSEGTNDFAILRCDPVGNKDTGFGDNGLACTDFFSGDDEVFDMCLQEDGKLISVGKAFYTEYGDYDFAIARYFTGLYAGQQESVIANKTNIYPNPVIERIIKIEYSLNSPSRVDFHLISLQGQIVFTKHHIGIKKGKYTVQFELPEHIKSGSYFIKIQTKDQCLTKKIFIQ